MDTPQIVEHLISVLFGGAGGIAAGVVRVTSKLSLFESKIAEVERRLEQFTNKDNEHSRQLESLKQQFDDKLDAFAQEISELRKTTMEYQAEVQRSLGAIEGTLNALVYKGCARVCEHYPDKVKLQYTDPDVSTILSPDLVRTKR